MANEQRKEPWNNEIYSKRETRSEGSKKNKDKQPTKPASTIFLTILVVVMFVIIVGAVIFTVWNNRYPNMNSVKDQFYNGAPASTAASSQAPVMSTDETSTSSTGTSDSSDANTYTIVAGDYPSVIASKTGVSWDQILKLNPKLDPNNPGYYTDGTQLTAGQTLKIR